MGTEILEFDCIIVGGGIAGLTVALELPSHWKVAVIAKGDRSESATRYAQGGVAAVQGGKDSSECHFADTLDAGDNLCNIDAVHAAVTEGPAMVRQLDSLYGVGFSRSGPDNGKSILSLGIEGGHSFRRVVHAGDYTGLAIQEGLVASASERGNIQFFERHMVLDLITTEPSLPGASRCCGANTVDLDSGSRVVFRSHVTVMATGGMAGAYLFTSNPEVNTGDGLAMAYRAGAILGNLEFIQFHPTCLWTGRHGRLFLLSESLRGEGGVLRTVDGRRVMEGRHPMGDLAPRDITARVMADTLRETGAEHLYLDMTGVDADYLRERFPSIYSICLEHGYDLARKPVPVVPAAHYTCGGIMVNLHGESSVQNLFAVGEASCTGLHGANRLAANSLLEGLVFGRRAASRIVSILTEYKNNGVPGYTPTGHTRIINLRATVESEHDLDHIRNGLRTVLWALVGINRTQAGLQSAVEQLGQMMRVVESVWRHREVTPNVAQLRNMIQVGQLVARCALFRKESRGGHHVVEHPERDDSSWRRNTLLGLGLEPHKGPPLRSLPIQTQRATPA